MRKIKALKLNREVIRTLASGEVREAVGGAHSLPAICLKATGASCDCTQICF